MQAAKPAGLWPRCHSSIRTSTTPERPFTSSLLCAAFAAALMLAAPQNSVAQMLPTEQAAQAEALVDTAGVNTHLTYTNTPYYTAWPQIFSSLQSLGVKHIRDGYFSTSAE